MLPSSVVMSRQDIYDYCRSVFTRCSVRYIPVRYAVGSEIILVKPEGYYEGDKVYIPSIFKWANAENEGFVQFYRLYHLQITGGNETEKGIIYYTVSPVAETAESFPSTEQLDADIIGYSVGESDYVWRTKEDNSVQLYLLDDVIYHLNQKETKTNRRQIEHLTGDIRERLYSTVNSAYPDFYYQRDMFRYRLLWQSAHCAFFYGTPFLLCLYYLPALSLAVMGLALTDCYFARKAMKKFHRTATLSLYKNVMQWKAVDSRVHLDVIGQQKWALQTSTLLRGVKTLPLMFLGKRQQTRYLTRIEDILKRVEERPLSPEAIVTIRNEVNQLIFSYSTCY